MRKSGEQAVEHEPVSGADRGHARALPVLADETMELRLLNEEGVTPPVAVRGAPSAIRQMLRRPLDRGEIVLM